MRIAPALLLLLAACQPPAADDYLERGLAKDDLPQASAPIPSPDTTEAIWAPAKQPKRLLFGVPGETPLLAMQCEGTGEKAKLTFTRFVRADREAQAMMALVGNFHALRLPVDSTWNGRAWLWQGSVAADNPDLEALTGTREVEATVPGAGTLVMAPSPLTRELIDACRSGAEATAPAQPAR
ncbi:hypothetical protein LY632_05630 [Erythrobacter sp. SDW2]|uniref:hypothetical protein n=1 Tax=Erythrobacter sp. SDW2 TaxID=2907154 RepID=UPI001F479CDD|nr:hypothetical protein [Erythrobacter sp. SDW2]UIP07876.1 hypothetical protein LY632_05630 [Erythrobacter sp. SDW2]